MTLFECITQQSHRLKQAGVSLGQGTLHSFDEAAWLVLWSLGLDFEHLEAQAQRPLTEAECQRAQEVLDQRIRTRKPAAYITGQTWLQNVPFDIDERAIIPRSFIAELLADGEGTGQLDAWLSDKTRRVLDLCTGNGSLAVIAALAYPEVKVQACDISSDALAVARRNVQKHGLESRIHLFESDLMAQAPGPYDLVLCNPPYVNDASMAALPPEFLHEPRLALAGGTDGMDLVRTLLAQAPSRLSEIGVLVLEIGHERLHFEAAFPKLEVAWMEVVAGSDQVLLVTRHALENWFNRHPDASRQRGGS
jgi:ribosomal protein L3 glutamine methyltransferase